MSQKMKVFVYMYDLSQGLASQFSQQLVGKKFDAIWHTSVVVFGWEYFYGGGIQRLKPQTTPYGNPTKKIDMGTTEIPQEIFEQFLNGLRMERFKIDKYDLFKNNCNHFTQTALELLTGKSIPKEVESLPEEFLKTDMGKQLKPMIDALMGGTLNLQNMQQQPQQNQQPQTQTPNFNFGNLFSNMGGSSGSSSGSSGSGNSGSSGSSGSGSGSGSSGTGNFMPRVNPQQMLQNPMIQNMLRSPEFIEGMINNPMFQQQIQSNPMLRQMYESNPMMQQFLRDPQMISRMMNDPMVQNLMTNPQMMNQMMNQYGNMGNMPNMPNMGNMPNMQNLFGNMGNMGNLFGGNTNNTSNTNNQPTPQEVTPIYFDKKEIFRYKQASVSKVVKKLWQFCDGILDEEEKKKMKSIEKYLLKEGNETITNESFLVIKKLLEKLPEKKVFPVLDVFRLLILNQKVLQIALSMQDSPLQIIFAILKKWDKVSMPTQLMVLRTFCNMFSSNVNVKVGALYIILNQELFENLTEVLTESLQSKLEGIRLTATSLAANLSLFVQKNGNDEETQLLCTMIEYLPNEPAEDVKEKMLLTISRILEGNTKAIQMAKSLDFSIPDVRKKIKKTSSLSMLKKIEKIMK